MNTKQRIAGGVVSALLCAGLVGCRASDVVMCDACSGGVVWGSVGIDTDWREKLSMAIDGKNSRFHTLQILERDHEKKARLKLRAYNFAGMLQDERVFDSDITYIGDDSFIVSCGGLYWWKGVYREDVFYSKSPTDPSKRIINNDDRWLPTIRICPTDPSKRIINNLDHEELRRYDPMTGKFVRIELPGDWGEESTSHHFDYCNDGIVVLARHGPFGITHYSGETPVGGQIDDGSGIFRIGHDGSVTEILRENDKGANRLRLVSGWSRTYFAAKMANGDVRIFDKDCHEVRYVQLSQSHAEFVKKPFFCVYEWIDDATIACYSVFDEDNDAVVLAIDARTGKVREAVRSEFNLVGEYRVRLTDSLILEERF